MKSNKFQEAAMVVVWYGMVPDMARKMEINWLVSLSVNKKNDDADVLIMILWIPLDQRLLLM